MMNETGAMPSMGETLLFRFEDAVKDLRLLSDLRV